MSLFIAITLAPMLASRVLKARTVGEATALERFSHKITGALDARYVTMVRWALRHRLVVVLIAVGCVAAAVSSVLTLLYFLIRSGLLGGRRE